MSIAFADIAFTPRVRAEQERRGSARAYAKFLSDEREGGDRLGLEEAAFLSARDGFYQASVSETGWPYVQFRGGQPGFLKVLDERTIAYADFRGNRQYLSVGNLSHDDRVSLIAMDYPNRRRLKIWGHARLIDAAEKPDVVDLLRMPGERATVERAVVIRIAAFDWNCPQHIPQRLTPAEYGGEMQALQDQIAALREENAALRRSAEKT